VENVRSGRTDRPAGGAKAGTFRPALPKDAHGVLKLFAIAARAACASPDTIDAINARLSLIAGKLVAPEAFAAQECLRLWKLFARVANLPKEQLRQEAGLAFCRDLDALGQRLDLAPLMEWQDIPDQLEEPGAEGEGDVEVTHADRPLATLAAVREEARVHKATLAPGVVFPAAMTAQLLASLDTNERRRTFDQMVGAGVMGRSEVNLLIRFMLKGDALGSGDTLLTEILQRLGRWLAQ
jgi:hypothetical protein